MSVTKRKAVSGRSHECSTCGQCFHRREHLMRHHRIHTGEKPFSCEVCKKRFSRSDELLRHVKIHSKPRQRRQRTRSVRNEQSPPPSSSSSSSSVSDPSDISDVDSTKSQLQNSPALSAASTSESSLDQLALVAEHFLYARESDGPDEDRNEQQQQQQLQHQQIQQKQLLPPLSSILEAVQSTSQSHMNQEINNQEVRRAQDYYRTIVVEKPSGEWKPVILLPPISCTNRYNVYS